MNNIRNFVITAHIDAGKSTLADRLLERTGTIEARKMQPQYLDQLELERERGITIKMAPVRMVYRPQQIDYSRKSGNKAVVRSPSAVSSEEYILNLIDTPGHSDFSYEVSRALAAVEGAVLLVDAIKGIQAQTLSNFRMARNAGLKIVGAVNKVDLNPSDVEKTARHLASLLDVPVSEILRISGRTGQGVDDLLGAIVEKIPAPSPRINADIYADKRGYEISENQHFNQRESAMPARALIFDSLYDDHKGIIAFVRIFGGAFKSGDEIKFLATDAGCKIKELGYFTPELKAAGALSSGEIGYIATGLKEPSLVKIGDTITKFSNSNFQFSKNELILQGYKEPSPVVFVSFYPDEDTKFEDLKRACERLRLTDSALSFEPDSSEALGRGLKMGFLGQLHFEIASSRLEREFGLKFLTSFPSIAYRVKVRGKVSVIKDAHDFPPDPDEVFQPMIKAEIFAPPSYVGQVMGLKETFFLDVLDMKNIGEHVVITARMPLAELMRDFDDRLKSVSAGFASFSYEPDGEAPADVEKLEILINNEAVPALTRIVFRVEADREARVAVEKLKELLPQQQFTQALQARVRGRIIARETIAALRKDVTGYLYGGDRTRKMKLWKKQKEGKEKLKRMGRVSIAPDVFRELLKK